MTQEQRATQHHVFALYSSKKVIYTLGPGPRIKKIETYIGIINRIVYYVLSRRTLPRHESLPLNIVDDVADEIAVLTTAISTRPSIGCYEDTLFVVIDVIVQKPSPFRAILESHPLP